MWCWVFCNISHNFQNHFLIHWRLNIIFVWSQNECNCPNPLLCSKHDTLTEVNCCCIFNTIFSSQTSCTIVFISPLIVREIFSLVLRRQAHILREWLVPVRQKEQCQPHQDRWGFESALIWVLSRSSSLILDCQASLNTASHLRCWPAVKAALVVYTTGIIVDDFCCCFMNVPSDFWLCQHLWPLTLPASLFGLLRFSILTLTVVLDLNFL